VTKRSPSTAGIAAVHLWHYLVSCNASEPGVAGVAGCSKNGIGSLEDEGAERPTPSRFLQVLQNSTFAGFSEKAPSAGASFPR